MTLRDAFILVGVFVSAFMFSFAILSMSSALFNEWRRQR